MTCPSLVFDHSIKQSRAHGATILTIKQLLMEHPQMSLTRIFSGPQSQSV